MLLHRGKERLFFHFEKEWLVGSLWSNGAPDRTTALQFALQQVTHGTLTSVFVALQNHEK